MADRAPAVDVQETDGEYLVKADPPEVKKEDVTVEIQDGMLSVGLSDTAVISMNDIVLASDQK